MISIITITYNNFRELEETINSLREVDPKVAELIIINGGNCQESKNFLGNLTHPLTCKIVQEPDKGISDAFNKGLSYASGNAITFLNSGDKLLDSHYYQKSLEIFLNFPEVSFTHSDINYNDPLCGLMRIKPRLCNIGRGMPFHHQTMVVKKDVFNDIGNFKLKYKIVMDYDFTIRMINKKYQGYYLRLSSPPIYMDGHGVSATQEERSIAESGQALKENNSLSPFSHLPNFYGYYSRRFFFFLRKLFTFWGFNKLIKWGKKIKNDRATSNKKAL